MFYPTVIRRIRNNCWCASGLDWVRTKTKRGPTGPRDEDERLWELPLARQPPTRRCRAPKPLEGRWKMRGSGSDSPERSKKNAGNGNCQGGGDAPRGREPLFPKPLSRFTRDAVVEVFDCGIAEIIVVCGHNPPPSPRVRICQKPPAPRHPARRRRSGR